MDPRQQLDQLANDHLLRSLHPITKSLVDLRIIHDGCEMWNFASNDYLGLSTSPEITSAFIDGIRIYGAGSAASRLITGTFTAHVELEKLIASAKHSEAALTFSSGFTTALCAIPVIVEKGDFIVVDRLAHASLIDAARHSQATLRVFPHNDLSQLASTLSKLRSKHPKARILVVTESIFSMDGDRCPLREIVELCEANHANILLDEAHAIGILGPTGMGLAEELGLQDRIDFQMGTLSKAVGLSGGYIAASRDWIDLMINRARPFIYTTAPQPAIAHAAISAIQLIRSQQGAILREKLFQNISILQPKHPSAILPVILGEYQTALDAAKNLKQKGYLIPAIRFPTVPKHTARLRITLSAKHPIEVVKDLSKNLNLIY
ncbi:MAG: aminotransferase class I/II-fold pyridoxal phosphate-dependent enzyme [Akkermansiaceae bacterium]